MTIRMLVLGVAIAANTAALAAAHVALTQIAVREQLAQQRVGVRGNTALRFDGS
jgi:hypothetical protein